LGLGLGLGEGKGERLGRDDAEAVAFAAAALLSGLAELAGPGLHAAAAWVTMVTMAMAMPTRTSERTGRTRAL
jgi:hypothetical protein